MQVLQDLGLSLFAVVGGGAPGAGGMAIGSVWDMVLKGGWVMIPIGLCSLVALTITVERLLLLRKEKVTPRPLLDALGETGVSTRTLRERCNANQSPLAAVVIAAIGARDKQQETRDRLIEEAGQREVLKLRRRTRLLSSLPQVATMLGLLGTVIGMIRTFTVVAASGDSLGKTERLAQGIYEAWTATAAGLVVAIPTLIAYHLVMGRIDDAAASLDRAISGWLEEVNNPRSNEHASEEDLPAVAATAA